MLFNSFKFLIFFPLVCLVYFLLRSNRSRTPFLLVASYFFYMNWKPVYAVLILASTAITYFGALLMERGGRKRLWLSLAIILNLAILFVFKYHNFINGAVATLLSAVGLRWPVPDFRLLLPVGISFYTFQALGYLIDVYRGTLRAERNFLTYALFVSFFPQLVAGPIERARNLLPQFHQEHRFSYTEAREGLCQMLWGFFMKLCVADVLSQYVDAVFNNVGQHNGTSMAIASIFFAFQIYCDFGGYSNIAIGAARVMGFGLMENFHRPYLSLGIKEFWKRWHISLSSWFMDYLYIPLGGNRCSRGRHLFNLMVTFLVSGLWHGANWTFLLWGALHGVYQVVATLWRQLFGIRQYNSLFKRIVARLFCFVLVVFAWIFFRANNVGEAFTIVSNIFTNWAMPYVDTSVFSIGLAGLALLVAKDVKDEAGWSVGAFHSKRRWVRYLSVVGMISFILLFGALDGSQFIYFQF